MSFLLFGLIGGIAIGMPTLSQIKQGGFLKISLALGAFATLVFTGLAYLNMPQLIGPFFGPTVIAVILFGLALRTFATGMDNIHADPVHFAVTAGFLLLAFGRGCAGCAAFHADDYRGFVQNRIQQREWSKDISPVDPVHVRWVGEEQASWKARQALGQVDGSIGSKYQLGSFTIQKVGNELMWVSPLEYQGFMKWASLGFTPGYVKVSAEDPEANAEVVIGKKFIYMETAFFGQNLERHIYDHGYQFRGVTDYSFEIDDSGHAYWVATLYTPTIQFSGEKVIGALLIDPETGAMTEYTTDKIPAWVDRVLPESFAEKRISWYGEYVHGWWNSVTAENDVTKPTPNVEGESLWLVWGDDGNAYWFTGLTSSKNTDNSLVGFIMMDSRTGRTFRYTLSGSDENAVLTNVNSKVSNFPGYRGTQPVLYNMYGHLTWVVPVITSPGILQRVALVDATRASEIVLGNDRQEALDGYRQLLSSKKDAQMVPSLKNTARTINGTVARIAADTRSGNTTYYIVLGDDPDQHIFTGASTLSVELPIAVLGDHVAISYDETDEQTVPMSSFDIPSFIPRVSREQSRANELEQDRKHPAATPQPQPQQ